MADFILSSVHDPEGAVVLAAAIMLLLLGTTLMGFSVRIKDSGLARRVDLVDPQHAFGPAPREQVEAPGHGTRFALQPSSALSERNQREVARRLARLHISTKHMSAALMIIRLAFVAILGLGFLALGTQLRLFAGRGVLLVLTSAMFAIIGWFIPLMIIARMAKSRARNAANSLPDALELLVVCVEAGLALEDGIDRMVIELRHSNPDLADEFALTSADLKILPNREQALFRLADRIDLPSVRSVVTTLAQSMRYGTPLVQAMRVVASEMRNDSLIAMEERANRLPTLMTLPMMLFIMPTIFLIVGGPAALRVIDTFLK